MRILFIITLLHLFISNISLAQPSTDSLFQALKTANSNEAADIYLAIAKQNWRYSTDSIYKYSVKALELADKAGYSHGKAKALVYIGVTHFYRANYDSALYYYDTATKIFKANNDPHEAAITINNTGVLYKRLGEYEKALDCYNEAMAIQELLGDVKEIGGILLNIGNIHAMQNELDESLSYYLKALEKFESIRNKVKIAGAYTNIGEVYADLGKTDKALEYYRKAMALQEQSDDKYGIANSLSNIGIIYKTNKQYLEAEVNLNRGADLYAEMKDQDAIAWVLNHLGELYSLTGQSDKAFDTYRKAIQIQESIGNEEGLAYVRLKLAGLWFQEKDFTEAEKNIGQSIEIGKRLHISKVLRNSYLLLSQIDSARNRNTESLAHYKLYTQYKDTILNEESNRQIAEMQTKYETTKKEQEIEQLQQEKKVREIKMRNNRIVAMLSLVATVVLFFFLFILYRFKQRKKENKLLLKNTMETEDKERKYFAEELHDGIGPLLSTVKLYINELDDGSISSSSRTLLTESNKIIDDAVCTARNLSHNLMPQNIEDHGLVKSLQVFTNRVCLQGNPTIQFNTGDLSNYGKWQQVMIYRIVTELISNSIKHASAESVKIDIKEKNRNLTILYEDTGKGFNIDEMLKKSNGIGLRNVVSRIQSLNGKVVFDSGASKGFKARIEFDTKNLFD